MRIHDRGGSSHLAIGPVGQLGVCLTPLSASGNKYDEGLDLIAASSDGRVAAEAPCARRA